MFDQSQDRNIGVLARVRLDEGALTGAITEDTIFEPDDFRAFYFQGDRKMQVVEHVAPLQKDLAGVEGSLTEIALRFCLSHAAGEECGDECEAVGSGSAEWADAGDTASARLGEEFLFVSAPRMNRMFGLAALAAFILALIVHVATLTRHGRVLAHITEPEYHSRRAYELHSLDAGYSFDDKPMDFFWPDQPPSSLSITACQKPL